MSSVKPTIAPLGEAALLVFFENRISPSINGQVHQLRRNLLEARIVGIIDLIAAYASLLVTFDPNRTSLSTVAEAVKTAIANARPSDAAPTNEGKHHTIPVEYGGESGPDLRDVASIHGISQEDVIRIHTGRAYRVSFLGFLPGFAYLGKLAPRIATPRLASPRIRVEAGSVGLAGGQTAVYPFASPGGWRIIGRTSLPVWDSLAENPARFAPGDTVHFVRSAHEPATALRESAAHNAQRPAFDVLSPGGFATIQDLGRSGMAHLGLAQGGTFDMAAATRANALAGNAPNAAVLEMTWSGPTLRALRNIAFALDGADLECRVDGAPVPPGLSWFVRRGSTLRFSRTHQGRNGVRGYMAVAGGFDVPTVLGSRATHLQAGFGGYQGRAIRAGDILGVGEDASDAALIAGKYWPGRTTPMPEGSMTLRYIPYNGRGQASPFAQRAFPATTFLLTGNSDRMGSRFQTEDDEPLPTRRGELLSFGVVRGAIQLPPDGNPVVLNVDHQTTGGYPLIGVVIRADWPLLAQAAPGTVTRFVPVTVEEALAAAVRTDDDLSNGLRLLGR